MIMQSSGIRRIRAIDSTPFLSTVASYIHINIFCEVIVFNLHVLLWVVATYLTTSLNSFVLEGTLPF